MLWIVGFLLISVAGGDYGYKLAKKDGGSHDNVVEAIVEYK